MNMTPMIDIVFLLIIFFMTVSQITRTTKNRVQLPTVEHAENLSDFVTLTVTVDAEGDLFLRGDPVTLPELAKEVSAVRRNAGADQHQIQLFVKIDKRADSQFVNRLLVGLRGSGVSAIRTMVIEQ
ncbi:MAG: biopolymer transporter ExbD [Pirellulaceae bacterium]